MMTGAAGDGLVSRREFLRRLGLGAATVFVVADGGLAYRVYDQGVFSEGRGPAFEALETWRDRTGPEAMVAAAVLAASAHNTQPWAFTVSDERIDLYADTTRATGANDPLLREFYISLGCALENLVLAARANGYQPAVTPDPGTAPDLVATVDLKPGPPIRDELYEAIGRRRSNRSEYTTDPVPVSVLRVKMQGRRGSVRIGILIGANGFTSDARDQEIRFASDELTIAFLGPDEMSDWIGAEEGDEYLERLIRREMLR